MFIDNKEAETLVKNPTIKRMPPIVSSNATGICNSTGNPMLVKNPENPGLNFGMPWTRKITPTAALIPK